MFQTEFSLQNGFIVAQSLTPGFDRKSCTCGLLKWIWFHLFWIYIGFCCLFSDKLITYRSTLVLMEKAAIISIIEKHNTIPTINLKLMERQKFY